MAAIAESDDLHAWLIRGFVECGLADHTRGGREWLAAGALNLENYIEDQGAGGLLLQFQGQAGNRPLPEDEYTYSVRVVRGPAGTQLVVRSPDTLFHHAFPASPREALAAHILRDVKAHNDAFTAWRAQGGEASYAQRLALPDAPGSPCDAALVRVLETLRRANRSVVEGPVNKWWITTAPAAAGPARIEAGLGQEPMYRSKKAMVTLRPEDLEHAARLRTAGTGLVVSGILSLGFMFLAFALSGYNVWQFGFSALTAQWWTLTSLLAGGAFSAMYMFGGMRLRALRSRGLVRVVAILGMFPCFVPCCGVGIPAGGWVLYLLHDARSSKVFSD